jgi:hypothetical protein
MKKLLLLGLILAILILAMPQGVSAATAPANPVVNANIAHTLVFTAPSPAAWVLDRGTVATDNYLSSTGSGTAPIVMTVDSANGWGVTAVDANILTGAGHMVPVTPFTPAEAGPLVNALQVMTAGPVGPTGTYTALPTASPFTPVTIRTGVSGVTTWNEDLKQTVALTDYSLTTGGPYRMTITFTCTET